MPLNNMWLRQHILCRPCRSLQEKHFKRTLGLKTHTRLGGSLASLSLSFFLCQAVPCCLTSARLPQVGQQLQRTGRNLQPRQRVPGQSLQSPVEGAWLIQPTQLHEEVTADLLPRAGRAQWCQLPRKGSSSGRSPTSCKSDIQIKLHWQADTRSNKSPPFMP